MKRLAFRSAIVVAGLVAVANAWLLIGGRGEAPQHAQIALVPGALVYPDGRLSGMLEDRVATAARLYHDGRVEKVLVSGDHGQTTYDEVTPMRLRLLELGVPARDVFEDHAGFDTWASAVRAREVFGARDAIVVTQEFHLARAVWLARRAGLEAGGVAADRPEGYGRQGQISGVREILARTKALATGLVKPDPTFLGPPISLEGDGRVSWGPAELEGPTSSAASSPRR